MPTVTPPDATGAPGPTRRQRVLAFRDDFSIAAWPFLDQIMVSGTSFLTNIIIVRTLGGAEFGVFVLAWTQVLLVLSVQNALIIAPMFSLAPRRASNERDAYFGALTVQELALAALVFGLAYGIAKAGALISDAWPFSLHALPLATAAAALLWQDFVRRCLFARGNGAAACLSDAISYPGQLLCLLVAARFGIDLNGVLWIFAATSAVAAGFGMMLTRPLRWERGIFGPLAGEQWRFGRWLLGGTVLGWIDANAAYVAVGILLGTTPVAGLRTADLVLAIGQPLYQSIENFLPSRATHVLLDQGEASFKSFMRRWSSAALAVSAAISLVAVAAPELWDTLLFGSRMGAYAYLIYPLAFRPPLVILAMMAGVALRTKNANQYIFLADTLRAAISLSIIYPVTANFGILGAAIVYAAGPGVGLLVLVWGLTRTLGKRGERAA